MKNLEELKSALSVYAKDIKINLETLLNEKNQVLSMKQIFGSALASAYAIKDKTVIVVFENEAQKYLSQTEMQAVKTAATLMAMNNIYYRFAHLTSDKEYLQMPAGLRMQGLATHEIDKLDFEIFALAVSIINGCSGCIDAHAHQIIKHGSSKQVVQMIAKIAAIINAAAQALQIG